MSISAFLGLPGAGKSYGVLVNVILPALRAGRTVVTNLELIEPEIRKEIRSGVIIRFPTDLVQKDPDTIWTYCIPGSVVVLDEVWRLFPSGQKANQVPESFRSLLAEHRHMVDRQGNSMQIILVTHDCSQIASFARQLVETSTVATKLTHVGADNRYRVDLCRGPVSGTVNKNRIITQAFGKYEPKFFKMYVSHTQSQKGEGAAVNEKAIDRRGNVWKRPSVLVGIVAVVALFGFSGSQAVRFFSEDGAVDSSASENPQPVELKGETNVEARGPDLPPPGLSRLLPGRPYRIRGYVHGDNHNGVALIENLESGVQVHVPWTSCWKAGDGLTRCIFDEHEITEMGAKRVQ